MDEKFIELKLLQFAVVKDIDKEVLKKYGDKIEESSITQMIEYKFSIQYQWITLNNNVLEIYYNAKKKQWELCRHIGNDYDKNGNPIVRREVVDCFNAHKDEIKILNSQIKECNKNAIRYK